QSQVGTTSASGTLIIFAGGLCFCDGLSNQRSRSSFDLLLKVYALGCPIHTSRLSCGSIIGAQKRSKPVRRKPEDRKIADIAITQPAARIQNAGILQCVIAGSSFSTGR